MTKEDILWVAPNGSDEERGTAEQPFADVSSALAVIQPGQIIILKAGTYVSDVTIEKSGSREHPIRIQAEKDKTVEISGATWYLYDVSNFILSGLTFRQSPAVALSVVGACECNRFENLRFIDCGKKNPASAAFFFGGSGARCNVVEDCIFSGDAAKASAGFSPDKASIGLVITEGDSDGGKANKDFIIRKCSFDHYDFGMLAGTRDSTVKQYSHLIEYNRFVHCAAAGIAVRCGDTTVRGNTITDIGHAGIAVMAGISSMITDNRISACETGVQVSGRGHTITNNCIFRCRSAVQVAGRIRPETIPATGLVIERNTMVDYGSKVHTGSGISPSGIIIEPGTTCVLEHNLFYGSIKPYDLTPPHIEGKKHPRLYAQQNLLAGFEGTIDGFMTGNADFLSYETDNFTNSSGYGAAGWMLTPDAHEPDSGVFIRDSAEELEGEIVDIEETTFNDDDQSGDQTGFDLQSFFTGGDDADDIPLDETFGKPHTN